MAVGEVSRKVSWMVGKRVREAAEKKDVKKDDYLVVLMAVVKVLLTAFPKVDLMDG
jgi:hypothetical protein